MREKQTQKKTQKKAHKTQTNRKSLRTQMRQQAEQAHGGYKTRYERKLTVERFNHYLKASNIQIKHIDQIKEKYMIAYIQYGLSQGHSLRYLQNEMSGLRQMLRAAGRDKLADSPRISNKALGLSGASRAGTKIAIPDNKYQEVHQMAQQKNPGLAAAIALARSLGLRSEEAVQSCQSLKTWQKEISAGKTHLNIVFGTKGGRPRLTRIINREQVQQAVSNAIQIAEKQNGKLIDKPNLKEAKAYWRNQCRALGLKGELSPHSLRYAFAQEAIEYYQQQGYSKQESLAMTSMDLGHGDGRGRYIEHVYAKNGEEK